MEASEDLHELIHSMSRSEKRYFKLYAQQRPGGKRGEKANDKNYLQLFNAIDAQDEFDQNALLALFAGTTIARYFSAEKRQLYFLILDALRAYRKGQGIQRKIREQLDAYYILKEKGLNHQALKCLRRAKKIAEKYEQLFAHLEILEQERKLDLAMKLRDRETALQSKIEAQETVVAQVRHFFNYLNLYHQCFFLERAHESKLGAAQVQALDAMYAQFPAPDSLDNVPKRALSSWHFASAAYHKFKRDNAAALAHYSAMVDLWNAHPEMQEAEPLRFKLMLSNYLAFSFHQGRLDLFPPILERLRQQPPSNFEDEAEIFQNAHFFELVYYLNTGQFDRGVALVPEIEAGIQTFGRKINKARQLAFFHNIAILYWIAGLPSQALKWTHRIIFNVVSEHRQDLQRFARSLQLILHFDLRNFDLLEYQIRSVRRYFQQQGGPQSFESHLVRYLKQALKLPEPHAPGPPQTFFRDMLTEDKAQPGYKPGTGFAEVELWLKSRMEARSTLSG